MQPELRPTSTMAPIPQPRIDEPRPVTPTPSVSCMVELRAKFIPLKKDLL